MEVVVQTCADLRAEPVQKLDLSRRNLGEEEVAALAEAVKGNDTLTSLVLNVCTCSGSGGV